MHAPRDDETDLSSAESGKPMGFWEHISDLRTTIIKSVIAFVTCAGLIAYFVFDLMPLVKAPLTKVLPEYPGLGIDLVTTAPMELFNLILELCVYGGLTLAAPFVLFFVAQFIAPALTKREMKVVLPMCLSACGLFLGGAAFAYYFLLPGAMRAFIAINLKADIGFRWSIGSYYSLFTRTIFGVGAGFEFPLLIIVLVWLGIVSTATLRHYRRHALVVAFVLAAVVTPSWDPFSQTLCATALFVLYEASIWVSAQVEKRRDRSGSAILVALLALVSRPRVTGLPGRA